MKILILTRYDYDGSSSRYRFFQYLKVLEAQSWKYEIKPLLSNNYIKYLYKNSSFPLAEIILGYLKRFFILLRKNDYDLIWLEQEAFPWIPSFFEIPFLKGKPKLVVDYDDAIFHRYDLHKNYFIRLLLKKKIDVVMSVADIVLAGNDYLAERAQKSNAKRIEFFPTVVDTEKFKKLEVQKDNIFTVGWLGSPSTAKYLKMLEEVFANLYKAGNIKFRFVGTGNITFNNLSYDIIEWSEEKEVEELSKFDVGIMPLVDGPFERGKCGFKLIQYLACEIPVVGSPVGINDKIIQHGINGFKATNNSEWIEYLMILKNNPELRRNMGIAGRKMVEENYSLKVNSKKIIDLMKNIMTKN